MTSGPRGTNLLPIAELTIVTRAVIWAVRHHSVLFVAGIYRAIHLIIHDRWDTLKTTLFRITNLSAVAEQAIRTKSIIGWMNHHRELVDTDIASAVNVVIQRGRSPWLADSVNFITKLKTVTERAIVTLPIVGTVAGHGTVIKKGTQLTGFTE